ncbi:MAG: hypothetical protein KDK70_41260 [Myxococcales bacterium]|nr:hypothetical protein [Myxococcales bacterium]
MDKHNTFHSRATYLLMRLDYLVVLVVLSAALLLHADQVDWWRFAIAFSWIDVLGTLPAWYCYYLRRRGEHRSIPAIYYKLYNFAHSVTTNAVVVGAWYLATGAWEWAMLAAPIHLCGDRSLFGNVYKPHGLSFEPVAHPGYARFSSDYEDSGQW